MISKITRLLEKLSIAVTAWLLFIKKEKQYGNKSFSFNKITLFRKGFFSGHPIDYDFENNKYSDYVSDIENIKIAYLNHPYGRLLRNKLVFSNFFNSYFKTPLCFAVINKGGIEPVNPKIEIASFSNLIDLIQQKPLIMKPLMGTAGIGINLLEYQENVFYVNKKESKIDQIKILVNSMQDYLVTEYIEQGDFTKQFFSGSANTIRLTLFADPYSSSSFIPYSFMRFGRKNTIPADNISQGGLFSMINLETGELSDAVQETGTGNYQLHRHHPDSGVEIGGKIIPRWNELKNFFIKLGGLIKPFIKVAGWDIILTNNSFYVIEGNNGPDLYFQGFNGPLAKNQKVKDFLNYYKIR